MPLPPSDPTGAPAQAGAPDEERPAPATAPGNGQPDPRAPFTANPEPSVGAPLGPDAHRAAADYARAADAAFAVDDAATGEGEPPMPAAPESAAAGDSPEPADLDPVALAAKAQMADEYLILAQRTKADFENFRKRAARDSALAQERGIAKLARELLPAVDNLDRAVQAAATYGLAATGEALAVQAAQAEPPVAGEVTPEAATASDGTASSSDHDHEQHLASGIRLVHADVIAALARVGIEPFAPTGETFDPQFHEAVAQAPVPGVQPGTVVEVYQQGYRLGETVLRPARVLVAQ